jgi:hypothetical protein
VIVDLTRATPGSWFVAVGALSSRLLLTTRI